MTGHALAPDAFAPLVDAEARGRSEKPEADDAPRPILPVPASAPRPSFAHNRYGTAASSWAYKGAGSCLLGYAVRFDTAEDKQVLPLTWCRLPGGGEEWRWKAFPPPRPLYGLDRLAVAPSAPVLVVEGEKTADAAQARFGDHVVVTWPGGGKAVAKVDWTALRGRKVAIWPDADPPGAEAAREVAKLVLGAGAASSQRSNCLTGCRKPGTSPTRCPPTSMQTCCSPRRGRRSCRASCRPAMP